MRPCAAICGLTLLVAPTLHCAGSGTSGLGGSDHLASYTIFIDPASNTAVATRYGGGAKSISLRARAYDLRSDWSPIYLDVTNNSGDTAGGVVVFVKAEGDYTVVPIEPTNETGDPYWGVGDIPAGQTRSCYVELTGVQGVPFSLDAQVWANTPEIDTVISDDCREYMAVMGRYLSLWSGGSDPENEPLRVVMNGVEVPQNEAALWTDTHIILPMDKSTPLGQVYIAKGMRHSNTGVYMRTDPIPFPPSHPIVTAFTDTSISISWLDSSNNETGFGIERKVGAGGTYSLLRTVGEDVTAYTDNGLFTDTTYYYRVYAFNPCGQSAYAPEISTTTYP